MSKKNLLILIAIFSFNLLFADTTKLIGIVRPQLTESEFSFLEDYKCSKIKDKKISERKTDEELLSETEDQNSEDVTKDDEEEKLGPENNYGYDKKILTDMFGSGFIYVAKDGRNYVITNHHVVENFLYACIEFVDSKTGEKKLYEDLKVVAISDKIDLALLEFPENQKPFKESFKIYNGKLKEEQIVYSAGFPALNDFPAWQLAKGNISNASFYNKQLIDPDYSYIIQHTAPIDSGNSGGPLLMEDSSSAEGYTVVGVNTWKYYSRELTGFTIPGETVLKFLKGYFEKTENEEEVLKERAKEFALNLSKKTRNFTKIQPLVSLSFSNSLTFEQTKNICTKYNLNYLQILYSDTHGATITIIKNTVLSNHIWNMYKSFIDIKDNSGNAWEIQKIQKIDDNLYEIVFEDSKKENKLNTTWIKEMNMWSVNQIAYSEDSKRYELEKTNGINTDKRKKLTKQKVFKIEPLVLINFSFLKPITNINDIGNKNSIGFSFDYAEKGIGYSFGLYYQGTPFLNLLLLETSISGKFEICLGNFKIIPNVLLNGEACILTDEPVFGWGWQGGCSFLYENIGISVFYKDTYLYYINEDLPKRHFGSLGISFTYNFIFFM